MFYTRLKCARCAFNSYTVFAHQTRTRRSKTEKNRIHIICFALFCLGRPADLGTPHVVKIYQNRRKYAMLPICAVVALPLNEQHRERERAIHTAHGERAGYRIFSEEFNMLAGLLCNLHFVSVTIAMENKIYTRERHITSHRVRGSI